MPRVLLRSVFLVMGLCSTLPALACGPAQTEVCLGGCVCVNDPNGVLAPVQEQAGGMAASALEGWILRARAAAMREGTLPIPAEIRRRLLLFYPAQLLDGVRYEVGDSDDMSAARTMLQNPDIKAVTLVDIIVFRSRELAEHDAVLWAHELWHVQQYREWGSAEFARRYSRDFNTVEDPAYRRQIDVANALRAQRQ